MKCRSFRPFLYAALFGSLSALGWGAVYDIGPGQPYTTINSFPWYQLAAGDTVQIHYAVYHEFINISSRGTATQPIRVVGIPDPATGARPVIDGQNAVVGPNAHFLYTAGTPSRGVFGIGPSPSAPAGFKPGYIEVSGLTIQNSFGGTNPYNFTDATGVSHPYNASAASIYLMLGEHVTITNCVLTGSSLGFFVQSGDPNTGGTEAQESRDITLQYSHVYANGNPGSYLQHNIYTEGSGMVFQYNYLGAPIPASLGSNLKDRSSGTVIRFNWIEDGGNMLDLVDPQGSVNITLHEPNFAYTMVYGNIFHNLKTAYVVHYGGDTGIAANDRKGTLYFYNNTVVCEIDQSTVYQTVLLKLDDKGQSAPDNTQVADVRNNILFMKSATAGATPSTLDLVATGGTATIYSNWISPNWQTSYNNVSVPYVTGTSNLFVDPTNNPSFTSLAGQDYHLLSGSNAIDKGVPLANAVFTNPMGQNYDVVRQYVKHQMSQARVVNGGAIDFGALESGAPGPCSYSIAPALSSASSAATPGSIAVFADSGCSWSSSSNAAWLTIASGGSGTGATPGNLLYNVAANPGAMRTGTLTVAGIAFPVTQSALDTAPPTITITAPANGATVSNTVTISANASDDIAVVGVQFAVDGANVGSEVTSSPYSVTWNSTAVANGPHTITATARDGVGNSTTATITVTTSNTTASCATATYTGSTVFVSNPLGGAQTGQFTVQADVTPAGSSTSSPQENGLFGLSNGAAGALTSLAVIVNFATTGQIVVRNGGAYTATNTVNYVANQTYHLRFVVNVATHTYDVYVTPPSSAEVQIASAYAFRTEQASVTQLDTWNVASNGNSITACNVTLGTGGGCTYSIAPSGSASSPAAGGAATVAVTAGTSCAWTAASNASFITVTSGASGTGNGTVGYSVAANTATTTRSGTLTIAGQTLTVNQAAAACTFSIAPSSAASSAAGGTGSFSVTANGSNCAWTASSNAGFLTISSGASGTGNGTVSYNVAANGGAARAGTITAAGQTFTLNQSAAAAPTTVSFRQGVNSYAGVVDGYISNLYTDQTWNNGQGFSDIGSTTLENGNAPVASGADHRPLLKFTSLGIPTTATVTSATLTLTVANFVTPGTLTGYYLNTAWNGTSTSTFNWARRDTGLNWASPGASGAGTDTIAGKSFSITGLTTAGNQTITITLDTATVQNWVTNPASNQGVLLVNSTSGWTVRASSSETATIAQRPMLTITYQ